MATILKSLLSFLQRFRYLSSEQKGFSLIELIISLALMAILGLGLLQGLTTVALSQGTHDERVEALVAGRAHLESIKQAEFDNTVTTTPGPGYASLPSQRVVGNTIYDLQIIAQEIETGVQLITVVVSIDGREINQLQAYKVDR